jgi:hypothetical protein
LYNFVIPSICEYIIDATGKMFVWSILMENPQSLGGELEELVAGRPRLLPATGRLGNWQLPIVSLGSTNPWY